LENKILLSDKIFKLRLVVKFNLLSFFGEKNIFKIIFANRSNFLSKVWKSYFRSLTASHISSLNTCTHDTEYLFLLLHFTKVNSIQTPGCVFGIYWIIWRIFLSRFSLNSPPIVSKLLKIKLYWYHCFSLLRKKTTSKK
jgi:hypothetical protein